ncbi:MAG TPA: NlpC/P60 family protein [Acidimicrobiales bacterium]|nr:NlpC/P60 family protein [Acidimicrobiales bacterium]
MTPRHRRLGVIVGIALLMPMLTATASWGDPLAEKKAEAAQIQAQLEKQGDRVSVLAEQSNRAQLKVAQVDESLAKTQADVARSDEKLQQVKGLLAQAAVLAYVHGGSNSMLSTLARGGKDDMIVRTQYLRVTAADQRQIIGQVRSAREDFQSNQAQLQADRKAAAQAASSAEAASKAAAAAEDVQRVALSKVTGEIGDLVAAAQAQKEAEAAKSAPVILAGPTPVPVPILSPGPVVTEAPKVAAQATTTPTTAAAKAATPSESSAAPAGSGKGAVALAEAKKQLGKMYLYGGAGPDRFDCSGLTAWAWRAAGVNLSHSAYDQWFETTRVSVNAVQPGDLLFFGDDGVESIYHVAMYAGDGNLIEASTTGTPIRIRGWRSADLVGAGRPG